MGWLRGMLEARTARIDKAAGLSGKEKAGKTKKKRTKASEYTTAELLKLSDEDYIALEHDK